MLATQNGITESLNLINDAPAIRSDVAVMVANSLDIPLMQQIGFGPNPEYQIMSHCNQREEPEQIPS